MNVYMNTLQLAYTASGRVGAHNTHSTSLLPMGCVRNRLLCFSYEFITVHFGWSEQFELIFPRSPESFHRKRAFLCAHIEIALKSRRVNKMLSF
uniref:Uncharacterized protein n=1 Tax=Salarias fasciatus TaxID=181472 RepID=A0A672FV82_SALFA